MDSCIIFIDSLMSSVKQTTILLCLLFNRFFPIRIYKYNYTGWQTLDAFFTQMPLISRKKNCMLHINEFGMNIVNKCSMLLNMQ